MSDHTLDFTLESLPAEGTAEYKNLIQGIIAEFRANGGQVGGPLAGMPLLLLTTTGARTGLPRTNPVAYMPDNGRLVLTAAKEGDVTKHPDWFYNLRANPDVTVELGTEIFPARATILEGAERQRIFDQYAAAAPPEFNTYLHKTHLEISVIALDRVG
ncbi:MAG: nitroreductase/quinone reductase family protein [Thermomicrobiales bacterium]